MATWRDGAAYAPVERPDGFATPIAPELSVAPPKASVTPGSVPPPEAVHPPDGTTPLKAVEVKPRTTRNPREAFSVASALLTATSSARDPRQPFATSAASHAADEELPPPSGPPLPPPTGTPLAAPAPQPAQPAQPAQPQGHPGAPQSWPAPSPVPGAPQWQHVPPPPPALTPTLAKPQRTIAGVALFLFIVAFLVPSTGAITVTVAGVLLLRLPARLGMVGRIATAGGAMAIAWGVFTGTLTEGNWLLTLGAIWMIGATIAYMAKPFSPSGR